MNNLKTARELIADPARWTQHTFARNSQGESCGYRSNYATAWCAYGAALCSDCNDLELSLLSDISFYLYNQGISEVNDNIGHSAILRVFDEALRFTMDTARSSRSTTQQ